MGAHFAELPSRIYNPTVYVESPEQIEDAVRIYPGHFSYNGDTTRDYLPGIRGQGAYFGSPAYPTFANQFGEIFVLEKRFEGTSLRLPRISVGTVATLEHCTIVNIPIGRSYPKSTYEQRVVRERDTLQKAIGVAVYDFISGKVGEVDTTFLILLIQRARKIQEARKHFKEVRGLKENKGLIRRN